MKYIKRFEDFSKLDEALRDDIPQYMIDAIKKNNKNAEDILDMDVPEHIDVIPNTYVPIDVSDTKEIIEFLNNEADSRLYILLQESALADILNDNNVFSEMFCESLGTDCDFPTLDVFKLSYNKNFRVPISETEFSKNKTSLTKFIEYFNKIYPDHSVQYNMQKDKVYVGLRNSVLNSGTDNEITELYLYISDKPDEKLRSSVSNYYSSCMNLYTGQYNHRLVTNVFDPNTKICYIISDKKYTDEKGNIHNNTPISRCFIRYSNGKIMFDKVYPATPLFEDTMPKIITKYTGLENKGKKNMYYEFGKIDKLPLPYMDYYTLKNTNQNTEEINDKIEALRFLTGSSNIVNTDGYYFSVNKTDEYIVVTTDEALTEIENYIRLDFWFLMENYTLKQLLELNILDNIKSLSSYTDNTNMSVIEFFNTFETELNKSHFIGNHIDMNNTVTILGENELMRKLFTGKEDGEFDISNHTDNTYYIFHVTD